MYMVEMYVLSLVKKKSGSIVLKSNIWEVKAKNRRSISKMLGGKLTSKQNIRRTVQNLSES